MKFNSFFLGRIFRLFPLYLVAILFLIIIVLFKTDFVLQEPVSKVVTEIIGWVTFGIYGKPNINGYENTSIIIAGVIWSLRYEWFFYTAMPLLYAIITKKLPKWFVFLPFLIILAISILRPGYYEPFHLFSFLGGMIAPFLLHNTSINSNVVKSPVISSIALSCILSLLFFDGSKNNFLALGLMVISFTLIAIGNDLFGLLKNSTLKFLGDICYSTYLLHGLLLYIVMDITIGFNEAKKLSEASYCFIILAITPLLVIISYLGFQFIEKPFINLGKIYTERFVASNKLKK